MESSKDRQVYEQFYANKVQSGCIIYTVHSKILIISKMYT